MKKILIILLVIAIGSFLVKEKCFAYYCPYFVEDATSNAVRRSILSQLVKTGSLAGKLLAQMLETIRITSESSQKTKATIQKGFEWHANEMRNLILGQMAAESKITNFKTTGEPSKAPFSCCEENLKVSINAGNDTVTETLQSVRKNLEGFNKKFAGRKKSMDAIRKIPETVTSAENLFPSNNTLTNGGEDESGSLTNAMMMSYLITNPYPALEIDDDLKATSHGKEYDAIKKLQEANLALPQMAMSEIIVNKTATYELEDWLKQMYTAMGKEGEPEGVVDGKISADATLDTLTSIRYANPNWTLDIHTKSTQGLLRELLAMKSLKMEFMRRQMKMMQIINVLMAQNIAADMHANDGMQQLRTNAIKEKVKE